MKSAFERAMERSGHTLKKLSPEIKEALAEIDRKYDAKIAEIRLRAGQSAPNPVPGNDPAAEAAADAGRRELARQIAELNEKREREKARVRGEE